MLNDFPTLCCFLFPRGSPGRSPTNILDEATTLYRISMFTTIAMQSNSPATCFQHLAFVLVVY